MDANLDPSLHGLDLDEHLATSSHTGGQHESDIILGEYDPTQQGPDLQVHDGEGVGIATVEGVLGALQRQDSGAFQGAYAVNAHLQVTPALATAPEAPEITDDEVLIDKPGTNKKHWSAAEDKTLLELVDKDGPRNWARIAKGLGTARSGPSCCARWCRLAGPKTGDEAPANSPLANSVASYKAVSKGKRTKWSKWSAEEDAHLKSLVLEHGPKNWTFIASLMRTVRSDDSCCGRWTHYLAPKTVEVIGPGGEAKTIPTPKSNSNAANPRWTPREDKKLRIIKVTNPEASWQSIGDNMTPKRTAGSCRARWVQHIMGKFPEAHGVKEGDDADEDDEDESTTVATLPAPDAVADPTPSTSALPAAESAASASASAAATGPEPDLVVDTNRAIDAILDPVLLGIEINEAEATTKSRAKAKGKGRATADFAPVHVENQDLTISREAAEAYRLAALKKDLGEDVFEELAVPGHLFKPAIQNPWSPEEEAHLLTLVSDSGRKGWQKIADTLGTGRTAASVSARWQRLTSFGATAEDPTANDDPELTPTDLKGKAKSAARGNKGNWNSWLAEDDAELRALVAQHGKNSWVKVGRELSRPRSGYAVMSRWYEHVTKALAAEKELAEGGLIHLDLPAEVVDQSTAESAPTPAPSVSKRRWTAEEDLEVRSLYHEYGDKYPNDGARWAAISKKMSTLRPASACRLRWLNYLCKLPAPLDHLNNSIGVDLAAALTHDEHLQFLEMLPAHEAAVAAAAAAAGEEPADGMDIDVGGLAGASGEKRPFEDVASDEDELEDVEENGSKRQKV